MRDRRPFLLSIDRGDATRHEEHGQVAKGRMPVGYLSPRKRWYQRTSVRVLIAITVVYVLLTAALVLTHA